MRQKWLLVFLGIALVVGLIALPPAPAVQAGSNGQQLRIKVGSGYAPKIDRVEISGYMWNNQYTTKSWTFSPTSEYTIWGWWWKTHNNTNVKVVYHYSGINPETGYPFSNYARGVYVPPSQSSDIFVVDVTQGQQCVRH